MAASSLLTPSNCTLIMIDHQTQMFAGVESIGRQTLVNNTVGLATAAKVFNVSIILTTINAEGFSGQLLPQLQAVFPEQKPIDRTNTNTWEDENVVAAVEKTGRKKLIMAALWTEICLAFPVLSAIEAGYEVYFVTDASGGETTIAHDTAVQRMIQAGGIPVTWLQILFELQRDWAREETAGDAIKTAIDYTGAYGVALNQYLKAKGNKGSK
ncbi:hydrolase [Bacillus sp. FJAT-49732]|uniref:Hydrolase n=1 Tax=Lederbergia citrisecunda TaxID=2833583 RepID=A0A942YML5_9BACI|nr:hydrolase [Lederbergia citrisecunda]MBS4201604.1 hydrolase [Lederbergia citrisecunda]